jgi:HD-GYP domain-containing protein (c-di-GMP phosphodiesterase class II)
LRSMSIRNSLIPTKKYKRLVAAVHMVYRLVNSTYNVRELTLRLTRLLCQFIRADASRVMILDPEQKKIILIAIFDNKINILLNKKKDLERISEKERRVTEGYAIQEPHLIGLPLVADDNIGSIFIQRKKGQPSFTPFDREMLSVVAEQSVTAIKNLQLNEGQQEIILGSIEFIGKLLKNHGYASTPHAPNYFQIARAIAIKLNMNEESINNLYYASVLRDAGAIDIPYDILAKRSQLTPEEFSIIRDQPQKSAELIRPVAFLKPVLPILLYHREKYDGTGYPSGLKKDQIPAGASIMAVVEAFEAMTTGRPYKKPLNVDEAMEEIKRNSGTQFDPRVVHAFVELSKEKKFRNHLSYRGK